MSDAILADLLYSSSMKNFGSDEHMQIAGLINEAKKNVIEKDTAIEIRRFLNENPAAIEKGLSYIQRPEKPVWYEWPLETRSGHGGDENARTGCLIAPHPADEELILAVTGWSTDGTTARHAFSVALFDTGSMDQLSKLANSRTKTSPEASLARILSAIETTMPPGFGDEINILTDNDPMAHQRSYRDATAEIPYLLSIMLLERCNGGLVGEMADGAVIYKMAAPSKRGVIQILMRKKSANSYIHIPKFGNTPPTFYR